MKLAARDLVKFGLLYLERGMWNGRSIISADLVARSVSPAIAVPPPERGFYGWHWWVDSTAVHHESEAAEGQLLDYFYARGYGGQFVFVVPGCEAVVVTTRERNKKGFSPHDLFRQHIVPYLVQNQQAPADGKSLG